MLIDCDGCAVRGLACGECVVTLLLDDQNGPICDDGQNMPASCDVSLSDDEQAALNALATAGLTPRLRLIKPVRSANSIRGSESITAHSETA